MSICDWSFYLRGALSVDASGFQLFQKQYGCLVFQWEPRSSHITTLYGALQHGSFSVHLVSFSLRWVTFTRSKLYTTCAKKHCACIELGARRVDPGFHLFQLFLTLISISVSPLLSVLGTKLSTETVFAHLVTGQAGVTAWGRTMHFSLRTLCYKYAGEREMLDPKKGKECTSSPTSDSFLSDI